MKTEEFEHQLTELRPALYQFTKKFTRSSEDSCDLVQETLVKAWNRRASFRENKNLIGWLYIIMRNTFVNQYRKNLQLKNVVSGDLGFKSREANDATKADESTHIEEVWKVINSINPDLGKPFKMHLSGYKYEEIATELDIPLGTVKSRLFLARQEIRNQLPGYC
jgi:RNA polymerase sigma-70 factor (ECF subfamily)